MQLCLRSVLLLSLALAKPLWAQVDNSKVSVAALAKAGADWRSPKGADFVETNKKVAVFLPLNLSRKTIIELTLDSFTQPRFKLMFQSDGGADETYFETWDDTLVLMKGEKFQELGRIPRRGPVRLHIRIDPDAEEIAFYSRKEKKLTKVSMEPGPPGKRGLWLRNSGDHLVVQKLHVLPWQDGPPAEEKIPASKVLFSGPGKPSDWRELENTYNPRFANFGFGKLIALNKATGGFYPLKEFPTAWEIRIRVTKRVEDERCSFKVGFEDDSFLATNLTVGANKEQFFARRTRGGGEVGLRRESIVGRSHLVFRVFGKAANGSTGLSVYTADGELISKTKVREPRRSQPVARGIRMEMDGTLLRPSVISSIELLKWDGETPPKPIPGG